jgi:hypothetical protein
MDMKRPLMPEFLKKAEQKLLLNKPGLWSTRIHLVLYYGILFMAVLAVVSFLDPMDMRRRSVESVWIGYVSILSVIALVVWLIYFLRFNVFKKYGIIHPMYSLVNFILIFIATVVIALFTQVQPVVESIRANYAYGDEEIVKDINAMNLKLAQLENATLHEPWEKDTILVLPDSIADVRGGQRRIVAGYSTAEPVYNIPYEIVRESHIKYRLESTDSVIRINDSMYLLYETPPFAFIDEYDADDYTELKVLSAFELYHQAVKPTPPANKDVIAKELDLLTEKYLVPADKIYYNDITIEMDDSEFEVIRKKYRLSYVNRGVYNVVEKKYRWAPDHLPLYVRVFYYIGLGISLLIFMFRHSTVKTFFLSLLTAILLTIFTSLFLAYSGFNETGFYMALIIYALLFLVGSLASWMTKKRNVIAGISTNLFVLLIPVLPLVIAAWYYEVKTRETYENSEIPYYTVPDSYWLIAEWSGVVLFLILLATYIHRVYRRWYSLPEE